MLSRALLVSAVAVIAGSGVMAQDLSKLPTCAQSCAISGIGGTGCAITDLKCICSAQSFLASVGTCTTAACSADDLQKTYTFAQSLCGSVGVTLNIPGQQPASTPASTPATTPTTTYSTTTTKVATVPYPTGNATSTVAPSGAVPTSPSFQGAAPGLKVGSWLGGLAAVAGLVLAL